jgi:asparagine synthase (glutamine-hydrolysing)
VLTRTSVVSRHYFDANTLYNEYVGMSPLRTTRERIERAVQRQLVADVPIGCFLSGGIDSSIIAATMTRLASDGQEVLTFSIGFDDPRYDETGYAAAVARMLGTRHEHFTVHPDAAADLPTLAAVWGEPFGDSSSLPTHYLARETRQRVKVALSGDGGDELFGGYDRYRAMRMTAVLDRLPSPVRRLAGSRIMQTIPGTHPKSTGARLKRFLLSAGEHDAARRYVNMIRLFDERLLLALVPEWDARGAFDSHVVSYFKLLELQRDPVEAALASDRTRYLPGDLLTKVDRCSMLHSLEVRSPFMDHELVEFAANLTTPELLKGGPKRMLREAFAADLPAWVFKRKKMGFAVPIGEWFRSSLRPMLRDHLFATDSFAAAHFNTAVVRRLVDEHESQRTDHSQRLYALLMLELWWRTQQHQRTQRVP